MPTPPVETRFTASNAADAGRRSGETRRRRSAVEMATTATAIAIEKLLTDPPPLTDEQRDRLRTLLAVDEPKR